MEPPPAKPPAETSQEALYRFAARVRNSQLDTSDLDATAAEVITALEAAGVNVMLLKGRALGALLYDDLGGGRGYSDVDLLVAHSQLAPAEAVLSALGYSNADAIQGVDDLAGVVQAHTWVPRGGGAGPSTIDLHWALPGAGARPSVQWEALLQRTTRVEVGGRQVTALDRPGQAMHLAMHAAQHGPSFEKHLSELSMAIDRWPLDGWRSAASLASAIGAADSFAAGLRLVPGGRKLANELALPTTHDLEWMIRHRGSAPRGTLYVQALLRPKSFANWFAVLRRSLLPKSEWIRYQHPWTQGGRIPLAAGYVVHLLRAPLWAAQALAFLRRARRQARG